MSIYTSKICTKCKTEKPLNDFSKCKKTKDGLREQCKVCLSIQGKLYYKLNKEKQNKSTREWRLSNKERKSMMNKNWYENNREHTLNVNKIWSENNQDKRRSHRAKRRATQLHATPSWYEAEQINELYRQCKLITESTGILHHVDHIVPLQSELVCGLHCLSNLRIIPATENMSKKNTYWPDMP